MAPRRAPTAQQALAWWTGTHRSAEERDDAHWALMSEMWDLDAGDLVAADAYAVLAELHAATAAVLVPLARWN